MSRTLDLFDGPPADARIVRPAVPSEQMLQLARLRAPDKLSRGRIAALVKEGLSSGRDVYVVAANNAEGSAPLTLFELAKAVAN